MEINGHEETTGEEIDQACDTRDEVRMTLSDKSVWKMVEQPLMRERFYPTNDVKKFIKKLKEGAQTCPQCKVGTSSPCVCGCCWEFGVINVTTLDKFAGDKLI